MWARFTPAEMARRWGLARRLMDRHDVLALLLFGNSGVNRHNQANVFWLSNHLDLHHSYLLAPRDEAIEPALYVGLGNHVPDARRIAQIPVVAWGGHDPAATVAEPDGCLPAQNPSGRLLAEGDVIITEISASSWGYSGQIHRPVFVRAEPTAAWQRLFDAALDAYQGIVRVMTLHRVPFEPVITA